MPLYCVLTLYQRDYVTDRKLDKLESPELYKTVRKKIHMAKNLWLFVNWDVKHQHKQQTKQQNSNYNHGCNRKNSNKSYTVCQHIHNKASKVAVCTTCFLCLQEFGYNYLILVRALQ